MNFDTKTRRALDNPKTVMPTLRRIYDEHGAEGVKKATWYIHRPLQEAIYKGVLEAKATGKQNAFADALGDALYWSLAFTPVAID